MSLASTAGSEQDKQSFFEIQKGSTYLQSVLACPGNVLWSQLVVSRRNSKAPSNSPLYILRLVYQNGRCPKLRHSPDVSANTLLAG